MVYLERLKKLRAAGGLSEPADQVKPKTLISLHNPSSHMLKFKENVENFSGGVSSGGVREGYSIGELQNITENKEYNVKIQPKIEI